MNCGVSHEDKYKRIEVVHVPEHIMNAYRNSAGKATVWR
jgi:hypothetical protein